MANYPAGSYEIKITGTVGSQSDFITFVMELVDPCPTATISLNQSPITDDTYTLRDPE